MSLRRRISRSRRGGIDVRLPLEERALVAALPLQLERLLESAPGAGSEPDESLRRLFPVAYARDAEAERAYSGLVRGELLEHRREALAVLAQTADAAHLSDDEADAWLGAINDLRLVLGTTLAVTEDAPEVAEGDPGFAQWSCYAYLSYLQGELVDALASALPPPVPGADDEIPVDPWGELPGDLRWDGTPKPGAR
ncbi:MAG TPA: DUF2017 family protein [Acidimicrobiales bacterium]|nr:DUF2017 family protein [Acidimicrobiales bacterium]